jgi:hypothetical protein
VKFKVGAKGENHNIPKKLRKWAAVPHVFCLHRYLSSVDQLFIAILFSFCVFMMKVVQVSGKRFFLFM